jgi:hypothetical protein
MDETDPLVLLVPEEEAGSGGPWRMVTTWWASDAKVADALRFIQSIPEHTPERHEAEAGLHMLQARWAWRRADELRRAERYRRTPRHAGPDDGRRKVTRGTCPACGVMVRLRLDGGVRAHDRGSGAARTPSQDALHGAQRSRCEGSGRSPA